MTDGSCPSAAARRGGGGTGRAGPKAGWAATSGGRRGKAREHGRTSAVWARNKKQARSGEGEEDLKEKDFHFEKHSNN
jgi:hypothetical protein